MNHDTGIALKNPEVSSAVRDALTNVLRHGAQQLLAQAIETEVEEFLLLYRDLCLEFCGDSIILHSEGRLPVERIPRRLQQLVEIRNLLPAYLFEKHPKGR